MRHSHGLIVASLMFCAMPAHAEERDYCPARPGVGTPACTIAPGRVSVETGLIDWTRQDDQSTRTDTVLIGDTLVRIGLSDSIEAQFGWTPYGQVRTRDKASGQVDRAGRVGDVTLGLKANLAHPDGKGLSIAVQPFATLPVGRSPVGAGDWGAGVVVPVTYDLNETLNLQATSEADAAVNGDGRGRHLAYSEVLGLGIALDKALNLTLELEALRDDDPAGHTTQGLAAASLAFMANDATQLDVGAVAGISRDAPAAELYVGISRRF